VSRKEKKENPTTSKMKHLFGFRKSDKNEVVADLKAHEENGGWFWLF
jgi:hypothetical protein